MPNENEFSGMNQKRIPGVRLTVVLPEFAPSRIVVPKASRNVVKLPNTGVEGEVQVSATETS
jgi:hypothetical protein